MHQTRKRLLNHDKATKYVYIGSVITIIIIILVHIFVPILPQHSGYHDYADKRTLFGIPFFYNVISNVFFVVFGLIGFVYCLINDIPERWFWCSFFICDTICGIGSGKFVKN